MVFRYRFNDLETFANAATLSDLSSQGKAVLSFDIDSIVAAL